MIPNVGAALLLLTPCPAAPPGQDLDSPIGWDPRGRYIAYMVDQPTDPAGRWQIWVTDTEPETSAVILRSAEPLSAPSWSPDGRKLAVFRRQNRNGQVALLLQFLTPEGRSAGGFSTSPLTGLPPDASWLARQQPQWSPTNPQITMVWWHQGQPGVTVMELKSQKALANLSSCVCPSWSVGGRYLFFRKANQLSAPVFAWDSATQQARRVWNYPVPTWRPGWTPDGRHLVVLSADGKRTHLSLTDLDGSNRKPVAKWNIDRVLMEYVVSADGRAAVALMRAPRAPAGQRSMHVVAINLRTRIAERAIGVLRTGTSKPTECRPHALSIGPLGIQCAARYRLPNGTTAVALLSLRTGDHQVLKHRSPAVVGNLRENLAFCRRLAGQSTTDQLLAAPDIKQYLSAKGDERREATLLANKSLNTIETQCHSYRPKDMPADLLCYAAQFHLLAGHSGQSLKCLNELKRRDPGVAKSPDFRLFQITCLYLDRAYLDAVAAAKLMMTDTQLTPAQRQQAQAILHMAQRRSRTTR